MGLISGIMGLLFGSNRNVIVETAQVFRPNAENTAIRDADAKSESLQQFAAEFIHARQGVFDRLVDALNRLPRPMLALGTIWLFTMAMVDPVAFGAGMTGLALVPEPLWWLMGAIVSFYFGARHQAKEQDFQRILAAAALARPKPDADPANPNPALRDWLARDGD